MLTRMCKFVTDFVADSLVIFTKIKAFSTTKFFNQLIEWIYFIVEDRLKSKLAFKLVYFITLILRNKSSSVKLFTPMNLSFL